MGGFKRALLYAGVGVMMLQTAGGFTLPTGFNLGGISRNQAVSRRQGDTRLRARPTKSELVGTEGVIEAMQQWSKCIMPERNSRQLRYVVSTGTTVPEVIADFWKSVSEVIDDQRATKKDQPFRQLRMFVAPFCPALLDYGTFLKVEQFFAQCDLDSGCKDFGSPITLLHYHPNYENTAGSSKSMFRHAPYPAFSLNVFYAHGGKSNSPLDAYEPRTKVVTSLSPKPRSKDKKKADIKQWAKNTRTGLEQLYNSSAHAGVVEKVEKGDVDHTEVPESSAQVLKETQRWVGSALRKAKEEQNAPFPGTDLVKRLGNVSQYIITRSHRAEDVLADVWEAVVELVERAQDAGCDVNFEGPYHPETPCYSAVLVAPDYSTFQAGAFKRFGRSLRQGLQLLPVDDDISIHVFHPELVSDTADNHSFRRSPYPTIHIVYEGYKD
ncbi:unnamed protein product [Chrysoparadoxa australica]